MRPGAKRRDHGCPIIGVVTATAVNKARRESPGSRHVEVAALQLAADASMRPDAKRRDHCITEVASMRPGAKRRDQPFGQHFAPDCGLASMRPDAKRRDHVNRGITHGHKRY